MSRLADYPMPSALQQSFDIINGIQGLPSCHRMAADALINSCATLEAPKAQSGHGMTSSTDSLLNAEHSLYAARMTACDLQRDQLPIPAACQDFVPTQRSTRKRVLKGFFGSSGPSEATQAYPDYEAVTTVQLPRCIKVLHNEGKGQGWTAYIANFHGAKVTCNAMRTDIDKDEHINLMRVLLKTTADVDGVLAGSRAEMVRMAEQITDIQISARKYLVELHQAQADYQEVVAGYMADLQALADTGLDRMAASFQRVQVEADLTVDIVKGGHREMQNSLTRTQSELTQLSLAQVQQWDLALAHGTATVDDLVAYLREHFRQSAEQAAGKAAQQLQDTLATVIDDMAVSFRNQTEEIHQDLDGAREKARLLNGDWSGFFGWVKTGCSFLGYLCVYSLLSYAFWGWLVGLSVSGNVCVSLAMGIVLANTSIAIGDPIDLVTHLARHCKIRPDLIYGCTGGVFAAICLLKCVTRSGLISWAFKRERGHEQWLRKRGLPSTETSAVASFRLPINDPRYMTEKQARLQRW
ncbi:hypothetical protein LTR53_010402 [Teratosphaeriaceae sp. CCFEE 6253]|nr:hypothetical protein LTR53_010402 [Teratosphaeriaceae sp. CCFEE 6253]